MIEPDEMINVRMRDEHMFETLYLAGRQIRDVAEVEQDRTLFKQRLDIERRIPEAAVDQAGMQEGAHECG